MDVSLWDLKSGKIVQSMKVRGSGTESLEFSPDGELLAERKGDQTIRLWETATGKQRSSLKISAKSNAWAAAFSPSGEFMAVGRGDGDLRGQDLVHHRRVPRIRTGMGHRGSGAR